MATTDDAPSPDAIVEDPFFRDGVSNVRLGLYGMAAFALALAGLAVPLILIPALLENYYEAGAELSLSVQFIAKLSEPMARWQLLFLPFVVGSLGTMALFINLTLGRRALLKFLKTLIFLETIGLIAIGLTIYQAYLGIADSSFAG